RQRRKRRKRGSFFGGGPRTGPVSRGAPCARTLRPLPPEDARGLGGGAQPRARPCLLPLPRGPPARPGGRAPGTVSCSLRSSPSAWRPEPGARGTARGEKPQARGSRRARWPEPGRRWDAQGPLRLAVLPGHPADLLGAPGPAWPWALPRAPSAGKNHPQHPPGDKSLTHLRVQRTWLQILLVLGFIQVILGVLIVTFSLVAATITPSAKIRHSCPSWAGFSITFFTLLSVLGVMLSLAGSILSCQNAQLVKSLEACEREKDSCICCQTYLEHAPASCSQQSEMLTMFPNPDCRSIRVALKVGEGSL
uniref:Family with sequence similarity 189 member B n=1 Tax=Anas zonorhyncha TaxID=75864 RepID=A0A8B9V224_9AVES